MKIAIGIAQLGGLLYAAQVKDLLNSHGYEIIWLFSKKPSFYWKKLICNDKYYAINIKNFDLQVFYNQNKISCLIVNIFSEFELSLIKVANSQLIPSVGFLDFWGRLKDRITLCNQVISPNKLIVLDSKMKKTYLNLGIKKESIHILSNPYWETYSKIDKSFDPKKILIPYQDTSELKNLEFEEWLSKISQVVRENFSYKKISIVVKKHPSFKIPENLNNICNDLQISLINNINDWSNYFCAIGLYSSILWEAKLRGIPSCSFCLEKNFFDNFYITPLLKISKKDELSNFIDDSFNKRLEYDNKKILNNNTKRKFVRIINEILKI